MKKNKKKKNKDSQAKKNQISDALSKVDTAGLSIKEKIAFSVFKKMPSAKQEEVIRQAMNPQNIQKEKGKILKQLKEAVKSGEMSKQEAETIKSRLGLR